MKNMNMVASLVVVVLLAMHCTHATEYIVGDSSGWSVPYDSSESYDNWAPHYDFHVGDTLVFNFGTAMHDVIEVSKADYDTCDARHAIRKVTVGPARIQLDSARDYYFMCSFPNHCNMGQHLAIKVVDDSSLSLGLFASFDAQAPSPMAINCTSLVDQPYLATLP